MQFNISEISSGGIILSYQCSNQCRHCLYACAPDCCEWMTENNIDQILEGIAGHRKFLNGLHFAGGEPFIKPDLLEYAIRKAVSLSLPIAYVETNGFWCRQKDSALALMQRMKDAGLQSILVSCSPFHQEFIPFESVQNAVHIAEQVFGPSGVLIYTSYFYDQLSNIHPKQPLPFELYIDAIGEEKASMAFATEYGLIPNGRAATQLAYLYDHRPASAYFGETCKRELSSPHHIHIDLYGHYIAGLCAGIVLGDGRNLDVLYQGVELNDKPVLQCLVEGGVEALYQWAVKNYKYQEDLKGYIAKCHLCLDIRRHLLASGQKFQELAPEEFYSHLE
ncbi:radical SAM protein [bacterium]